LRRRIFDHQMIQDLVVAGKNDLAIENEIAARA
jgi:hypothetical protein